MGYPTPEQRRRMKGVEPGPSPIGSSGASSVTGDGGRHDRADAVQASYCTTVPRPVDRLTDACFDCGHATVLHVGVGHCPVCELVDLNSRSRALVQSGTVEIAIHGQPLDERYLADTINRQVRRHGRSFTR